MKKNNTHNQYHKKDLSLVQVRIPKSLKTEMSLKLKEKRMTWVFFVQTTIETYINSHPT